MLVLVLNYHSHLEHDTTKRIYVTCKGEDGLRIIIGWQELRRTPAEGPANSRRPIRSTFKLSPDRRKPEINQACFMRVVD